MENSEVSIQVSDWLDNIQRFRAAHLICSLDDLTLAQALYWGRKQKIMWSFRGKQGRHLEEANRYKEYADKIQRQLDAYYENAETEAAAIDAALARQM